MAKISFFEYCADFLDLHEGLMSEEERAKAYQSYLAFLKEKPKSIKQQKAELFEQGKDNENAMLTYHGITKEQFEAVTLEALAGIRKDKAPVGYKDPKRQLWHDYRLALTKKIDKQFRNRTKSR